MYNAYPYDSFTVPIFSILFLRYKTRTDFLSSVSTCFTQHKHALSLVYHALNMDNFIWPESFSGPKILHNAWKKNVAYTQLTDIMIIRNCPICMYDNTTDCVAIAPAE